MDVHRARFIPYPTPSISAAAFSRSADRDKLEPNLKLAIGRVNGSVELWSPTQGTWVQEMVFRIGAKRSIDGLLWTQEPDEEDANGLSIPGQHRLFSTSSSPAVTEWDLVEGCPKKQSSGNFSDVWCIAAQPRRHADGKTGGDTSSQEIVAGCSHGELVLLSTDDDGLQFKRILARAVKKTSCLSITYQTHQTIVAGFVDGMVRIYDTAKLTCLRSISLGTSIAGAVKNIHVWQVRCLANGDIASGDSNGSVTILDGKSYSPYSTVMAHETDCLDLVASADGNTIFSGSMDGRIAVLKKVQGLTGSGMWTKQSHRKHHNGEIKCLAAFDGKGTSVVVSGGSDVKAVVSPLRDHGRAPSITLPHLPQTPPLIGARQARLVVSWWEKTISVWRMARSPGLEAEHQPPHRLVAKIKLAGEHDIVTVAISDNGRVLAASTQSETKLFQLRRRLAHDTLAVRKIGLARKLGAESSRLMSFSPSGKWLGLITADNGVRILRLTEVTVKAKSVEVLAENVDLERRDRASTQSTGFVGCDRTVVRMAFASDSSVLAVADVSGYIDTWVLKGYEDTTAPPVDVQKKLVKQHSTKNLDLDESDSDDDDDDDDDEVVVFYGQHWVENPRGHLLPKLESLPLVLSFRPQPSSSGLAEAPVVNGNPAVHSASHTPLAQSSELLAGAHLLFVLTAEHQVHEFDVLTGHSSDWSRRNPTATLPSDFHRLQDRAIGAVWDVTGMRARLWLYGSSWLFMLNVGVDHQIDAALLAQVEEKKTRGKDKKRRKGARNVDEDGGRSKRRRLGSAQGRGLAGTVKRHDGDVVTEIDLDDGDTEMLDATNVLDADREDKENLMRIARLDNGAEEHQRQPFANPFPTSDDRTYWCTTRYRSVLGIVALDDVAAAADPDGLPEVVVVERRIENAERSK